MRIAPLVLAVVFAAAPAFAQTDPTAPPPTPAAGEPTAEGQPSTETAETTENEAENADQQQICRTVQRSESRLRSRRERICGTRAQWEQMQEQAARDLNRGGMVQGPGNQ